MPALFGRRKASMTQPPNAAVSSSATIAATSAFLRHSPSASSLSSSAAAAALRSQTTSLEPVANIQTKRMVRKASYSSLGSAADSKTSLDSHRLMRRSSSSSMTERTFRSPSPAGQLPGRRADPNAPPVPAVPALKRSSHGRSASMDVPKRVMSPNLATKGVRGSSVDQKLRSATEKGPNIVSLPQLPELSREDSQRSVNFSRPIASPTNSQPNSPIDATEHGPWSDSLDKALAAQSSTTRNGISERAAAVKPAKKKKTADTATVPESTQQSTSAQPSTSNTDVLPLKTPRLVSGLNAKKSAPPTVDTDVQPPPRSSAGSPSTTAPSPRTQRPTGTLVKQPSMVREEPELEDNSAQAALQSQASAQPTTTTIKKKKKTKPIDFETVQPVSSGKVNQPAASKPRKASLEVPGSIHAHFNDHVVDAADGPKFQPDRSVSPAKSALKNSPTSSPRTISPVPPYDDTASSGQQKKRRARVSFEGPPEGVSTSLRSTSVQWDSPSQKRPLSISADQDGDDTGMMKARPELPVFGSVRKQFARSISPSESPISPKAHLSQSSRPDMSTSSDQAIGAMFAASSDAKSSDKIPVSPVDENSIEPSLAAGIGASSSILLSADPLSANADKSATEGGLVPDISVQPATPGFEKGKADLAESRVPPLPEQSLTSSSSKDSSPSSKRSPPLKGANEVANLETSKANKRISTASENSDAEETFSDAAEDPADMEEHGGFASLDAIVESPISMVRTNKSGAEGLPGGTPTSPQDWHAMTAYWASLSKKQREQLEVQAAKHEERKRNETDTKTLKPEPEDELEIKPKSTPPGSTESTIELLETPIKEKMTKPRAAIDVQSGITPQAVPKAKKPKRSQTGQAAQTVTTRSSESPSMPTQAQPLRSSMKKTLLEASPPGSSPHLRATMRTSLRDGQGGPVRPASATGMRMSLRDGAPATRRPMSLQQAPPGAEMLQSKNPRPMSASFGNPTNLASSAAAKSSKRLSNGFGGLTSHPPRLITNDDSDSGSSFKKKRRSSVGHTMRHSMRASSPATRTPKDASSRWSVRSMSPVASNPSLAMLRKSLRASSIEPGPTMRGKHLRALSVDPGPTLRGPHSRARVPKAKSPSRFSIGSFSRSGSQPPMPSRATGSRFADSDSDDDLNFNVSRTFKSRLSDSSDDDIGTVRSPEIASPATMRSVRSLPARRKGKMDKRRSAGSDSDSDAKSGRSRRASKVSTRGAVPPLPSKTDVDLAMQAARRNVDTMLGKSNQEAAKFVTKSTGEANGLVTMTKSEEPSNLLSPTSTMTRRTSMLGSLFGRKQSSSSIPRIELQAGSPTTPQSEEQKMLQSPKRSSKLRRHHAPALQRLESGQHLTSPGKKSTSSVLSAATSGGSSVRNWPLPPPKMPAVAAEKAGRANSLDGATRPESGGRATARPKLAERSASGIVLGSADIRKPQAVEKGDKKKRFGKLRKAFGMH